MPIPNTTLGHTDRLTHWSSAGVPQNLRVPWLPAWGSASGQQRYKKWPKSSSYTTSVLLFRLQL